MVRPTADSANPGPSDRPLLALVNAMGAQYREYLLAPISERYRVWLFQDRVAEWTKRYIVGHTELDTTDVDGMVAAARALGVDGVLCWDETRIVAAAQVAQKLGVPGSDSESVRRCRDKRLTRTALSNAGVAQPVSIAVATLAEASAAADRIGYPVVVKPRALTGSFGVVKVESGDELETSFGRTGATSMAEVDERFVNGVLIEQYVDGPEISVDAICLSGRLTPLFLARKELGFPPYFEELGHVVDAADPLLTDSGVRRVLEEVHAAVGFGTGWTHTELRLTSSGPTLIEINARLGGDLIPYLGRLATGIEPGLVVADIASGVEPFVQPKWARVAGVRFTYPDHDATVGLVEVDEARLSPAIDRVVVLASPGQRLALPPAGHVSSRAAAIIAVSDTATACLDALNAAASAVRVHERPGSEREG